MKNKGSIVTINRTRGIYTGGWFSRPPTYFLVVISELAGFFWVKYFFSSNA